eukprot:8198383-Pyramimonas_sp.AAC.1
MLWRWLPRARPAGMLAARLRPGSIGSSWASRPGWRPNASSNARCWASLVSCTGGTSATTRLS